jgi:hypothetical protein
VFLVLRADRTLSFDPRNQFYTTELVSFSWRSNRISSGLEGTDRDRADEFRSLVAGGHTEVNRNLMRKAAAAQVESASELLTQHRAPDADDHGPDGTAGVPAKV